MVELEGTQQEIHRRKVPYSPEQLRKLAEWLVAWEVEEVVMESTALVIGQMVAELRLIDAQAPRQLARAAVKKRPADLF